MAKTKKWYKEGLRFQCQGSGKCCVSRGEYGYVYLDKKDRQKFADYFQLSLTEFTTQYCTKTEGYYHLNTLSDQEECLFLKDNKCSVYEARPTQCRTWPFWPEVLSAKTWQKEVAAFCPGIGKGKLYKESEIEGIANEQFLSEAMMEKEP
ncbi:MAG: YkgJ family cysteine cluster protein [Bdellovibrionales bacterium]|nr:YkgJ family cysteine cluster protein [Bdellovibrionales bacterium]